MDTSSHIHIHIFMPNPLRCLHLVYDGVYPYRFARSVSFLIFTPTLSFKPNLSLTSTWSARVTPHTLHDIQTHKHENFSLEEQMYLRTVNCSYTSFSQKFATFEYFFIQKFKKPMNLNDSLKIVVTVVRDKEFCFLLILNLIGLEEIYIRNESI